MTESYVYLKRVALLLCTIAVLGILQPASATEYEHQMDFDPPADCLYPYSGGNIGKLGIAGYAKSFYFRYNSSSKLFYMDALFQACRPNPDPNLPGLENVLNYPDNFTLAVNDGPNPNGIPNELAMMYFDAVTDPNSPILTIYGYNGGSPLSSYRDGDINTPGEQNPARLFSSHPDAGEDTSRIKKIQYIKDTQAETARFILEIDMTEVNNFFSNPDWTGAMFAEQIGYWFHPSTTDVNYPGYEHLRMEYCTEKDTVHPCVGESAPSADMRTIDSVDKVQPKSVLKTFPGYLKVREVLMGYYDSHHLPANQIPWCKTKLLTTHNQVMGAGGKKCYELEIGETISAVITGSDGDGDDLLVGHSGAPATAAVTPASGTVLPSPADVTFDYTANFADAGNQYHFAAQFNDNYYISSAYCALDICIPENTAPNCDLQITPESPNQCAGAETKVQVTANGSSDPDGDALSYQFSTTCEQGVITEVSPGVAEVNLTQPGLGTDVSCEATVAVSDGYQTSQCSVQIEIAGCDLDCLGQPNGSAVVDQCGVCNGNNACLDCLGVPNGNAKVDSCGVCNGTNECLDCLGTPNGNAVIDRCGVCDGDGLSCIQCESVDITELLFQIDGTTLEQLALGKTLARRFKRKNADDKTMKKVGRLVSAIEELHQDSWSKAWSLDLVQSTCEETIFCVETDNSGVKTDLVVNSRKAKKRIKKLIKLYRKNFGRNLRKYNKRNNKLHNKTLDLEVQLPGANSLCQ